MLTPQNLPIVSAPIDYLRDGLDTPQLGVSNLGPSMKLGVYFKTHCDETIKECHIQLCISLQLGSNNILEIKNGQNGIVLYKLAKLIGHHGSLQADK